MATVFNIGIFLSTFILLSVVAGQDTEFLPKLEGSFQSYFKKTRDQDQINYGMILYDEKENILAIHYDDDEKYKKKVWGVVILNYTAGEVLKIEGNKCTVGEVQIEDDAAIFPFPSAKKNEGSKMELKDILLYNLNNCNETGDEYFLCVSEKTWIFSGAEPQNCDLQHRFTKSDDGKFLNLQNINITCGNVTQMIFEFYHFENKVTAPEELQQPLGVFCPGRNSSKLPPSLPDRFRLTLETIVPDKMGDMIFSSEVWYDTESEIILQDDRLNWNKQDELIIYEYKRGVQYYINSLMKSCKISDLVEKRKKMAPKDSYFWFQNSQYIGKKSSDGIVYDVWATFGPNDETVRNVFYIELLSRSMEDKEIVRVPVKMAEYVYSGKDLIRYQYTRVLHYEFYPIDWSMFHLTYCFDSSNQGVPFELMIEGPALPINAMPLFQESVHFELLVSAGVAAPRISNFQIHHMPTDEEGIAVITAVITENFATLVKGKDLNEGSAEESYQKLFRRVRHKDFVIDVKSAAHSQKLTYSATRVGRIPTKGYITPTPLVEPKIPPSFQTEFTLYFFSSIYHGSMLYDDRHKTLGIHFQEGSKKNFYIYKFGFNQELIITGWECQSKILESQLISIFPFAAKSFHHKNQPGPKSRSILLFDGENKKFVGEETDAFQRKFQKWGSTREILIDQQPMLCDLTHWFVVDDDNTTSLEAINLNCVFPENKDENGVEIIFHFSQFAYDVKNEADLQQPAGVYCEDKSDLFTTPQLPDRFRIGGDTLFSSHDAAIGSSFEVWYDTDLQLLRQDEKTSFNSLHTITISEFNTGVRYYIEVPFDKCRIQNMSETLPSKTEILKFGDGQKPQFVGQRIVNGVPHDIWSYASRDLTHVSEVSYVKEAETSSVRADVPVKAEVFNHRINSQISYRLFSFDLNPSDWSLFDLTHCFNVDQKIQFHLKIEGSQTASYASIPTFREEVHQQLLKHLQVSSTRVSNFKIFYLGGDGVAMVSGVLTEDPAQLGFGKTTSSEASAEQALKNLLGSVQNKAFTFKMKPTGEENEITFTGKTLERLTGVTPFPDTVSTVTQFPDKVTPFPDKDSKQASAGGYSPGSMAALGLCMLITGALLGTAIVTLYLRFKRTAGFQRQTNDGL